MLIGGSLANALAFIGSGYLFHRLSTDNISNRGLTESSNRIGS